MNDCSGIKSWEKVAEEKEVGYKYTKSKGNMNTVLAYLNWIFRFGFKTQLSKKRLQIALLLQELYTFSLVHDKM